MIICLTISCLIGYLMGSISSAIIVGKVFYKVDIREHGSKNAGGTNAGRVLGKKAGALVIFLDALKMILSLLISIGLCKLFQIDSNGYDGSNILYACAISVVIGHCYPIFFKFKGGKAVSTIVGFVVFTNYYLLILGFIIFAIVFVTSKMVSLSSILTSLIIAILSFIPFFQNGMLIPTSYYFTYSITLLVISLILIYKHKDNIKRILNGSERKVTWISKLLNKKDK